MYILRSPAAVAEVYAKAGSSATPDEIDAALAVVARMSRADVQAAGDRLGFRSSKRWTRRELARVIRGRHDVHVRVNLHSTGVSQAEVAAKAAAAGEADPF